MSWFRSAVIKAVEAGNKNNLNRFKTYADTVVQQAGLAVAEGAKIFQDRIGNRNFKSFKQTVKRLEEASVSCRGPERVHLMRRWLAALKVIKEIEELSGTPIEDNERSNEQQYPSEGPTESSRKQSMVLYYDSDVGGEPMNFRDVFLYSQALEGVSICMILEAPNEEEISLLLELFGLCLTGGKEVHNAIISSIQDLAKVFLGYEDEVLVKRDELLQFAEGAITGLKINADLGRIDAEVSTLKKRLEIREKKESVNEGHKTISQETATTVETLKETLAHIRACSRLEGLLLKKIALKYGDSPEIHAQKVDKLKILCESLASSSSKAERKISDQRAQREDALRFRVAKASEVSEIEKELSVEISALEKQRDELEAQLKQVKISLAAVNGRLRNAREERDQFYEANDQIVAHLRTKEDELSKVISSCRVEGNVLSTWINFMEDTWALQCSYTDAKRKEAIDELEGHEDYFVNLVIQLLSAYERDLKPSIDRIEKYVENLKSLGTGSVHDDSRALNPRNNLEEVYLDYETKIITTFSVVDNMREQYYAQQGKISRKDDSKVKDLFDNIEKLRTVFESIERPNLEMETPDQEAEISSSENPHENVSHPTKEAGEIPDVREKEHSKSPATNVQKQEPSTPKLEHVLDAEAELAQLESEFGKVNPDYSAEEIGDWEFDELERELRSGDSATNK
nr:coiled-coil domain-containing protein 18-like [Ipomoea batatas]